MPFLKKAMKSNAISTLTISSSFSNLSPKQKKDGSACGSSNVRQWTHAGTHMHLYLKMVSMRSRRGHPPIYETPEEMEAVINQYFLETDIEDWTITGLALALGFESRQSFYDNEKRPEFSYILKNARLKVEMSYEQSLRKCKTGPGGSIFALKNMGWKDKTEVVNETTHRVIMTDDDGNEIDKAKSDI